MLPSGSRSETCGASAASGPGAGGPAWSARSARAKGNPLAGKRLVNRGSVAAGHHQGRSPPW